MLILFAKCEFDGLFHFFQKQGITKKKYISLESVKNWCQHYDANQNNRNCSFCWASPSKTLLLGRTRVPFGSQVCFVYLTYNRCRSPRSLPVVGHIGSVGLYIRSTLDLGIFLPVCDVNTYQIWATFHAFVWLLLHAFLRKESQVSWYPSVHHRFEIPPTLPHLDGCGQISVCYRRFRPEIISQLIGVLLWCTMPTNFYVE